MQVSREKLRTLFLLYSKWVNSDEDRSLHLLCLYDDQSGMVVRQTIREMGAGRDVREIHPVMQWDTLDEGISFLTEALAT